ncbi:MAG: GTP pyrophosphokinase family protein [Solobacterium sp.]|nr:GTP pyrophosphokinase family protein [Solobacterium sp.]
MTGNTKGKSPANNVLMPPEKSVDAAKYLAEFHADFDPLYNMLMNYQCAVMAVETKFNILNERLSIRGEHNPIESIKSRVKSLDSIVLKLEKKKVPITIEAVEETLHDVAGVRVVCSFVDDIYRIEKNFLAQEDIILVERKDYIENPKPSGYRSLHLIIKTPIYTEEGRKDMFVEVQLRTIAMDFWASVEHKLWYKKDVKPELARELSKELSDCAEASAELDEKMLRIRDRIAEGLSES